METRVKKGLKYWKVAEEPQNKGNTVVGFHRLGKNENGKILKH